MGEKKKEMWMGEEESRGDKTILDVHSGERTKEMREKDGEKKN